MREGLKKPGLSEEIPWAAEFGRTATRLRATPQLQRLAAQYGILPREADKHFVLPLPKHPLRLKRTSTWRSGDKIAGEAIDKAWCVTSTSASTFTIFQALGGHPLAFANNPDLDLYALPGLPRYVVKRAAGSIQLPEAQQGQTLRSCAGGAVNIGFPPFCYQGTKGLVFCVRSAPYWSDRNSRVQVQRSPIRDGIPQPTRAATLPVRVRPPATYASPGRMGLQGPLGLAG